MRAGPGCWLHGGRGIAGALAGAITGLLTTPLDVMKTRLMTQGSSGQYKGILDCATKIAREEGLGTFLKVRPGPRTIPERGCEFVPVRAGERGGERGGREVERGGKGCVREKGEGARPPGVRPMCIPRVPGFQMLGWVMRGSIPCAPAAQVAEIPPACQKDGGEDEEGWRVWGQGWEPRVLWIGIGGSIFFTALELSKKLYAPNPAAWETKKTSPCCKGKSS